MTSGKCVIISYRGCARVCPLGHGQRRSACPPHEKHCGASYRCALHPRQFGTACSATGYELGLVRSRDRAGPAQPRGQTPFTPLGLCTWPCRLTLATGWWPSRNRRRSQWGGPSGAGKTGAAVSGSHTRAAPTGRRNADRPISFPSGPAVVISWAQPSRPPCCNLCNIRGHSANFACICGHICYVSFRN